MEYPDYGFSCEFASGNIYVFSTLWFDSGYMSASVYQTSGRIFPRFIREGGRSCSSRADVEKTAELSQLLH